MPKLLLLLLTIGLINSTASFAQSEVNKDVLEVTSNAVVCIDVVTKDGRSVIGSGFFVDFGWIVSSAHQLKDAKTTVIHTKNNGSFKITDIIIDELQDLALLKTDAPVLETLDIIQESEQIYIGQPVYTISCPYGLEHSFSRGVVSHKNRNINGKSLIQTDVEVGLGSSGAPLLNNKGQVLGVFNAVLEEAKNISFVVPFDKVNQIMLQTGISHKEKLGEDVFKLWQQAISSKDIREQQGTYEKIIDLAPWLAEAHYNLGLINFELQNDETAKTNFLKAIEINKDYYKAYVNVAIVFNRLNNLNEAEKHLKKAINIDKKNPLAYFNLGTILKLHNREDDAKKAFAEYLLLSPEESSEKQKITEWLK